MEELATLATSIAGMRRAMVLGPAAVNLGTAANFAVLAGSTVTNTGPTVVRGDLGVSPGTAVVGFPPGTVTGTVHAGDAVAAQAQVDLTAAYGDAAGRSGAVSVSPDIGGQTLTPGVYNAATSLAVTGSLTLDAQGDPNGIFIFQVGSTLTTAANSSVDLTGGAQAGNIFWQVGSSATLGTGSVFQGNILALTSITVTTGAIIDGRALARNGAVTLDTNTVGAGLTITTGSLPTAVVGVPYTVVLTAAGGVPPYTWAVTAGELPAGLALNAATGVISGTPVAAGTATFVVTVTDSAANSASKAFSITVGSGSSLTITTASLPHGVVGVRYTAVLTAAGGVPPYTWAVTVGALPAGLSLDAATGVISGTPLAVGTATFIVTVTDSAGNSASKAFSIAITMPCFLVEMLVDNCAEVVEDTQDFAPASALFSAIACPGLTTIPDCTNTSVTPAGLTIDCTILSPTCTVVGFSPDTSNPALTNVLFAISYSESVTVTEAGNGSCTVTAGPFTRLKMVQMTTSTVTQPLTYSCILDNYACACRLVDETADGGCHLVCNAILCVEFISTTTVKQEIASTACATPTCDPFPTVPCPPQLKSHPAACA